MRSLEAGASYASNPETLGTPLASPEVQLCLMLASYKERHQHEADFPSLDPTKPEEAGDAVFMAAGDEWVDEISDISFSERFRNYSDTHPGERIDLHDAEAIDGLLLQVRDWKPETLH